MSGAPHQPIPRDLTRAGSIFVRPLTTAVLRDLMCACPGQRYVALLVHNIAQGDIACSQPFRHLARITKCGCRTQWAADGSCRTQWAADGSLRGAPLSAVRARYDIGRSAGALRYWPCGGARSGGRLPRAYSSEGRPRVYCSDACRCLPAAGRGGVGYDGRAAAAAGAGAPVC